jgi:hypothetical protein
MRFPTLLSVIVISFLCPLSYGGNPSVRVTLNHPPSSALKLGKIVFGEVSGQCGQLLADKLTGVFVGNNVDVLDRANMGAVMSEHKLNLSGVVDSSSAIEMGKYLGADAMFILRISRCSTTQSRSAGHPKGLFGIDDTKRTLYFATTRTALSGSFTTIDLKTGKIFQAKQFSATPERSNQSQRGYPEAVPNDEIEDMAINQASAQISHLFFPWTEQRELIFFDDNDYNLKAGYNTFALGNYDSALEQAKKSYDDCMADPKHKDKHQRHTLHNIGMTLFAMGRYEEAIPYFEKAYQVEPKEEEMDALSDCREALRLSKEMLRYEDKASIAPMPVSKSQAGLKPSVNTENPPSPPALSPEERLKKISDLFKKGLVTKEEYDKKKAEILSEL